MAAGRPKRLEILPSLLEVQGKKIIDRQLEALHACGITDIVVVVGYHADKVKAHLTHLNTSTNNISVKVIENQDFETTGSAYSLWLACKDFHEEFIYVNGDLIFEADLLQKLLSSPYANVVGYDKKYDFTSDMQKVVLLGDRVLHHDKNLSEDIAHGEIVGPVKFSAAFAKELLQKINTEAQKGHRCTWVYPFMSEIAKYTPLHAVDITGLKWCEVDTEQDLNLAQSVFGQRNPFVLIMYGNPATGKTTTAKAVQEYCSQFSRTSLISTSNLREEIGLTDLHSTPEREEVYQLMVERVKNAMRWKKVNIVLDGNFTKFVTRKLVYDEAVKHGYQIFVAHCLVSDEGIISQRLEKRKGQDKQMEHAATSMELYRLIRQEADPLHLDTTVPLTIFQINTQENSVQLTGSDISENSLHIQNGIKYGFRKVPS